MVSNFEKNLKDYFNNLKSCYSEVGFIDGSITYDRGRNVPTVAYWQEYGVLSRSGSGDFFIPPRPFMSYSSRVFADTFSEIVSSGLKENKFNSKKVIEEASKELKDRIELSIVEWDIPANAAYTIAKKGFDDPLIETHKMLNSVDYKVKLGLIND